MVCKVFVYLLRRLKGKAIEVKMNTTIFKKLTILKIQIVNQDLKCGGRRELMYTGFPGYFFHL